MTATLERFWQWYDAESPEAAHALKLGNQEMSPTARYALDLAATVIDCHQDSRQSLGCRFCTGDMLEKFPGALRDLSLAFCRALEVMEAAVPRGEPAASWVTLDKYVTPWYAPQAQAMDHAADQLLASMTRVSEMHRASRKETREKTLAMYEGLGLIGPEAYAQAAGMNVDQLNEERSRVLAEMQAAAMAQPRGIIFYDPDKVSPETLDDYELRPVALMGCPRPGTVIEAKPAPERPPWMANHGCPGCGSSSEWCIEGCPLIRMTDDERRRAYEARDLTVPPIGRTIPT